MFYNYKATDIEGKEVSMEEYKGKVVLVVNTASKCGLTPQFEGLETLHQKYQNLGLEILGFPCNQFGNQDPGDDKEIAGFCQLNYGVTFKMFSKVKVNGDQAHPLWKYLRNKQKGALGSESIKWNFTKFLIDRSGNVVKRYAPTTSPEDLEVDIKNLLAE